MACEPFTMWRRDKVDSWGSGSQDLHWSEDHFTRSESSATCPVSLEVKWEVTEDRKQTKPPKIIFLRCNSKHAAAAKSSHSCPTLCNPMDCSPPVSSVHEILQARIPEWVAMPSSRGSSQPRGRTQVSCVSCICRWVLYYLHHLGSPNSKHNISVFFSDDCCMNFYKLGSIK